MKKASDWLSEIIREKFPEGVKSLSSISQAELLKILLARAEYTGPQGIQGRQGIQGEKGETGLAPAHEWEDTRLRFQNPDGTWGAWVDLVGDEPAHEWSGHKLRFKNPDGTWGPWQTISGRQTVIGGGTFLNPQANTSSGQIQNTIPQSIVVAAGHTLYRGRTIIPANLFIKVEGDGGRLIIK